MAATPDEMQFPWKQELYWQFISWYLWMLFFPAIYKLTEIPAGHLSNPKLLIHLPLGAAFAALHSFLNVFFIWVLLRRAQPFIKSSIDNHSFCFFVFLWRFLVYLGILAVCFAIHFRRRLRQEQLEAAKLESQLTAARLESYKRQLDPQFLFDILQFLSGMIREDVRMAERLIQRVGIFLRESLDLSGRKVTTLEQELERVRSFCRVEEIRTHGRLETRIDMDPETMDLWMPSLALQSVVKNLTEICLSDHQIRQQIHVRPTVTGDRIRIEINEILSKPAPESRIQTIEFRRMYPEIELAAIALTPQHHVLMLEFSNSLQPDPEQALHSRLRFRNTKTSPAESHPSFVYRWKGVLLWLGWATFAAYHIGRYDHVNNGKLPWQVIVSSASVWVVWALFTPLIWKVADRFPLTRASLLKPLSIHLGINILVWFVSTLASSFLIWAFYLAKWGFGAILIEGIRGSMFGIQGIVYWTIVALHSTLTYQRQFKEGELRRSELEAHLFHTEFQTIKMQLHPHFLFNALNSLSELMFEKASSAIQMLERLQQFLRLTLRTSGTLEVPLQEELEFIRCYLAIQQMRYEGHLAVDIQVEPEAMKDLLPNLLWQPVVENAIRHGIARKNSQGHIQIQAARYNGSLRFRVKDNGPGLSNGRTVAEGFGLSSTRTLLDKLYGSRYVLEMENAPEGGLTVTVEVPQAGRDGDRQQNADPGDRGR